MKISVCITVFNEEKTIGFLLEDLLHQSKKPEEILIIDAKSLDKTSEIIKHYQKKDKRIKLQIEKCSIAQGRNLAIDFASNNIIVLTDGGCRPKKNWLYNLTLPFVNESVDMVAGFYDMPIKGNLQKAISVYFGIPPERFNPGDFLPSARSVAFRKSVWEYIGGFDEKIKKAGEDTRFFMTV